LAQRTPVPYPIGEGGSAVGHRLEEKAEKMAAMNKDNVARVIDFLQENKNRGGDVSLSDVMHLAEVMSGSMHEVLTKIQPAVTEELTAIAREISRMKQEITDLRADDMKNSRIPEAGRELDAIVEATEDATNTIMEAAEEIMSADASDPQAYQDFVSGKMITIFEACTFQDITGQRISKVVSTLNFIDERVSAFVDKLRLPEGAEVSTEETEEERRKRELILHGPQHAGEGVSQSDVDAMLAEAQSEIDKLFD
jgi:chemotaxis protein CheZ